MKMEKVETGFTELSFHNVVLEPKKSKEETYLMLGYEADWIKPRADSIKITGLKWLKILLCKKLEIQELEISGFEIYVYRDKRQRNRNVYKPLLGKLLRNAGFAFNNQSIRLQNGNISYEEIHEKTGKPMILTFNHLNADIQHISSGHEYIRAHPEMTMRAQCSILDSIKVNIAYSGNASDTTDAFHLRGNIKSFSATYLNRVLEPAAQMELESGYINYINFHFYGNEEGSKGKVDMDYRDLKLKKTGEEKHAKLKAIIANILVKDDDKKKVNEKYTGEINFKRKKSSFIFNYWWNSFKTGIISSVIKDPVSDIVEKKINH